MLQRSYNQHNSHSKITNKLLYVLPGMALMIVAILAVMKTTTLATDTASAVADYGRGATFSVQQDLSLNIAINDIDIPEITPTATGAFQSGSVSLTVDTSNTFGYTLKMYAYDPYDTSSTPTATTNLTNPTALSSGADAIIETIASGSYTEAEFIASSATVNKWAYKNGTNYVPVTAETTLTPHDSQGVYNETVTFGAKVNSEKPNGLYSVTLNFVATVNPPDASDPRSGFAQAFQYAGVDTYGTTGLYAMQDMTSTICGYVYNEKSIQMVDKRDGKVYWVTKLADGNCWMTQNLDLDLSTSTTLTHADTDLGWTNLNTNATWTPLRSTIDSTSYGNITTCSSESSAGTGCWGQTNTGFASGWTNDNNTPYSDNPGYRYMTFTDRTATNPAWYSNGDTFANCTTQDTTCGGQGHYMIGNYYNFAAANATNSVESTVGHTVTDSDANFVMPNSICPKGWRMPKGQSSDNDFITLLTTYNIYGTGAMAFNYQGLNAIRRDPLYFVRSGRVKVGTLYNAGTSSYVWSSTISAASNGRSLYFYGTGINPADSNSRLDGFAVRCLAR